MSSTVLITGASTGIGAQIVELLLKRTDCVIFATARAESLSRFKRLGLQEGERLKLRPIDLFNDTEAAAVVSEINRDYNGVDYLINNAGVSYRAVVEHTPTEAWFEQLQVNFLAAMNLTRLVLPKMREKRCGRIINISSVAGMMAMPTMAGYSASKFALEGASESLWYELKPWNIRVTLIQPGFVRTEAFKRVHKTRQASKSARVENDAYHEYYVSMEAFIENIMTYTPSTPQKIAKKVLRVMKMRRPPLRISATFDAWLFYILRRLLPRSLYHFVLYRNLPRIRRWTRNSSPPSHSTPQALRSSSKDSSLRSE